MAFNFNTIQRCISSILQKIIDVLGLGTPTAVITGVQIPSVDLEKVSLSFNVLVTNPSRFSIPLTDMSCSLKSNAQKLLSVAVTQAETIQAKGSATIVIPVTLVYQDVLKTLTDIRPGSVIPYTLNANFVVKVPVFGKETVAFDYSGQIPIPQVPTILLERMEFLKFSFEECDVTLHLKLKNTNEFEMGVTSLKCELQLSSVTIGSAGLEKSASVDKSGESVVEIPISFRPMSLGNAVWQVVGGKDSSYAIKGTLGVETAFGNMTFPFSEGGTTSLIKTNS